MGTKSNERVVVIVDNDAAYTMSKDCGFQIDFGRLREYFDNDQDIVLHRAIYAAAVVIGRDGDGSDAHNPLVPLLDWLEYNQWTVCQRTVYETVATDQRRKSNTSMNCEITIQLLHNAMHCDRIVLFTNDSLLSPAVEEVKRAGARVSVVSTIGNDFDLLRRTCDLHIDFHKFIEAASAIKKPKDDKLRKS